MDFHKVHSSTQTSLRCFNTVDKKLKVSYNSRNFLDMTDYDCLKNNKNSVNKLLTVSSTRIWTRWNSLLVRHFPTQSCPSSKQVNRHRLTTKEYLIFAAISKLIAAAVTYPQQLIRARLQDQHVQYSGFLEVVRRTQRAEGIKGFYKGLVYWSNFKRDFLTF